MSQSDTQDPPASPVEESTPASSEGAAASGEESKLAELEAELARSRERLLRTAADFDNFRKRARKDLEEAERQVQERLLLKLLPTFDNLERAAGHTGSAQDVKALADGIQMVLRQFQDALSGLGIERIAPEGQAFDPAAHEAVQHVETNDFPAGAVVKELQAGYRWQGRLLRPALVVVAKGSAAS